MGRVSVKLVARPSRLHVPRATTPDPQVIDALLRRLATQEPLPPAEELIDLGIPDDEPTDERRPSIEHNLHERLRKLSAAARNKIARTGELAERTILERIYGKHVWEPLLRNPKLTAPEVSRIARMGALPLPLLEIIVGNRAWLSSGQVRRALLANRRLRPDMVRTVLRASPKSELKLMPKQTAYPANVREAARAMLKG